MADNSPKTELAILAGGCFWCLEAVYLGADGVRSVTSGYIGGHVDTPTYERICDGDTGHAEAVRIEFEPGVIGFPGPARHLLRHPRSDDAQSPGQ
jgi:peptide-methionine (S)-S-oxide reductase